MKMTLEDYKILVDLVQMNLASARNLQKAFKVKTEDMKILIEKAKQDEKGIKERINILREKKDKFYSSVVKKAKSLSKSGYFKDPDELLKKALLSNLQGSLEYSGRQYVYLLGYDNLKSEGVDFYNELISAAQDGDWNFVQHLYDNQYQDECNLRSLEDDLTILSTLIDNLTKYGDFILDESTVKVIERVYTQNKYEFEKVTGKKL